MYAEGKIEFYFANLQQTKPGSFRHYCDKISKKKNIQNIFRNLIQNQKHIRKVFFRSNIFKIGIKIPTNLTFMYTYTSRKIGLTGKNLNS